MAERNIQLATNLDALSPKRRVEAFERGGYASEKLDGVWAGLIVEGRNANFFSSSEEHMLSMEDTTALNEAIEQLPDGVYLGELWHPTMPQKDISGISRKKVAGHGEELEFHIHDLIAIDEYREGKAEDFFYERHDFLRESVFPAESNHVFKRLRVIPQVRVDDAEGFLDFEAQLHKHSEGAIFKPYFAGWEKGNRGTNVIRIKRTMTFDLLVTGVSEVDRTEKGGLTGGIIVGWKKFAKPEGEYEAQLIRGMSHAELEAWAENPSSIVGKIVEVRAMNITPLGYLREPRFKVVREDKQKPDV